jgi:hypothetical protein
MRSWLRRRTIQISNRTKDNTQRAVRAPRVRRPGRLYRGGWIMGKLLSRERPDADSDAEDQGMILEDDGSKPSRDYLFLRKCFQIKGEKTK